jgi:hypothetical protein
LWGSQFEEQNQATAYIKSDGIAAVRKSSTTNLITYSEDFSHSSWVKNNTTVTNNHTSPDGTQNAYLMTDNATDSHHGVYVLDLAPQDSNIYTRSVFVKKGTARYVVLSARHTPTSSGTSWIYDFDTNNFTLTGSSGVGQSIEVLTNGWIRLSMSIISDSNFNNDFSVGISSTSLLSGASYSGSGDTVYIYGGQVEQQSQATAYLKSDGIPAVRKATTTNLITDSQTFTGTLSQVNRESNSTDIEDPFGTNTAFKFTVLTSGADANTRITKSISVTQFSVSIYINGLAGQKFQLFLARDGYTQYFDTSKVLSGGWERIELNGTFSTASTTVIIGLEFGFTANDSVAGQEYYLTGLQLEEQTQAETYAPTYGLPVTIDLFTENNYGTMTNMSASDIIEDTP